MFWKYMGIFGKDGKAKQTSSKEPQNAQNKSADSSTSQVATTDSDTKNNISCWFKERRDDIRSWKAKSCEICDNPEIQQMNKWRKQFVGEFCHPMGNIYRQLPEDMTTFKISTFGQYNYRQRLFGLEGLMLFTAIITMRARRNQLGLSKRFMLAIRNSAFVFLVGGLFVAPEIYNPLIKSDF